LTSKDLIIVDGVQHQLKDCSLSSEKSEWEFVRKKRPHQVQGHEDDEVLVELEGPPMKKVAMAKAVVVALNKGFKAECKGKEKNIESLVEEVPQNPTKAPKIQTEAFMTPKGKSKPKDREVGEGSKDILTRSKFES